MKHSRFLQISLMTLALSLSSSCSQAQSPSAPPQQTQSIKEIFTPNNRNQIVMNIEAAIAQSQADQGVIPQSAAESISRKADTQYIPLDEIAAEYELTNHRMVALLNVWSRALDPEAANYLHYGVTTVDIYDTVRLLQIRDSVFVLIDEMREIEDQLLQLASENKDTIMIGRTIGQHALPITFGKKVSVWAAQNRRNIERLKDLLVRIESRGVLKGAVGTYLGLGPKGMVIEQGVSKRLGLSAPDPADWHGSRDVFAEYGQVLALTAKSYGAMAEEIFRLMTTDIGELSERQPKTNVGSSTMPHKKNPRRPERLVAHSRKIPRLAEILLDDVANSFERDNTSRPNRIVEEISLEAGQMMNDARRMINVLDVNKTRMRENLNKTDGMVMAQRIMLYLSNHIDRTEAEERVRDAARTSLTKDISFKQALLDDPVLKAPLSGELDRLLDPRTYLGLASEQVDMTERYIQTLRKTDPSAQP